ncbi:MAG: hypothetical protein COA99_15005 [Moraxellaceae bacterium]|nr:MAG: hypothetical protein COA99_15005 [Moraxellaceae bacterium]
MKKITVMQLILMGSLSLSTATATAEQSSGAKILEREAARARELQDLKFQAKLIEQRAKIAKAYQEFRDSGGIVPGDMDTPFASEKNNAKAVPIVSLSSISSGKENLVLPVLKKINGNKASFSTSYGDVEAKEGGYLPGGFQVLALSSTEGAKLEKDSVIYNVGFSWN